MRTPTPKPRVRKDGVTVYDIEMRIGGRLVSKTCSTEQDALDWAEDQRTDRRRGVAMDPLHGRVRLDVYARDWLANRRLPNGKPLAGKTIESYRNSIERYIIPAIGDRLIGDIRPADVVRWRNSVADRAGENTTAKAYKALRAILAQAVDEDRIAKNPCRIKGAGKEHSPERPFADAAAVIALADAIDPRLRAFILVAGFGGLRMGEQLGLLRPHVDLGKGTIRVERQRLEVAGKAEVSGPKTTAGYRTVKLPAFVVAELDRHLAAYVDIICDGERITPSGVPVFPGFRHRFSQPISRSTIYDRFAAAKARVLADGLVDLDPGLVIHDLRHSAGTLAAHTGPTTKELMARLGHSTHEAALRYQHAAQARDAQIAAGLDPMVEGLGLVVPARKAGGLT